MATKYINQVGYGLTDALPILAARPIVANRAPLTSDTGYQLGQLWVQPSAQDAWILTGIVANAANWEPISTSGGAGVFSSLTVTTGPISLTGTTNINVSGAANTNIGSGTNTGAVQIGSANSTGVSLLAPLMGVDSTAGGAIGIGASVTTGTINIGHALTTGAMVIGDALTTGSIVLGAAGVGAATSSTTIKGDSLLLDSKAAGDIKLGHSVTTGTIEIGDALTTGTLTIGNHTSSNTVNIKSGTGGTNITSGGLFAVDFLQATAASPTATVVINSRQCYANFTGFTTAAAASQVFTITNSIITAGSSIYATVINLGSNDAQMTLTRVKPGVGTVDITCKNNGAAALNGDVNITLWVAD